MTDSDGIRSVRRIEAIDVERRPAAVVVGHTAEGRVVLGVAPAGQDQAIVVFLNGDAQARLLAAVRTAVMDAARSS